MRQDLIPKVYHLRLKVVDVRFPTRVEHHLLSENIVFIGDLVRMNADQVLALKLGEHCLGKTSLADTMELLGKMGLRLGLKLDPAEGYWFEKSNEELAALLEPQFPLWSGVPTTTSPPLVPRQHPPVPPLLRQKLTQEVAQPTEEIIFNNT